MTPPTVPRCPIPRALALVAWLALVAGPAAAGRGTLHKCVDARGHASYQSQPCAEGQRQAWAREVRPEAEPPRPASPRPAAPRRDRVVAPGPARRSGGSQPPEAGAGAACRAARAADAAYRRRPLAQIRHAELRRLGDEIHRHCR